MTDTIDADILATLDFDDDVKSAGLVRRDDGSIELRYNDQAAFLFDTQVIPLGDDEDAALERLETLATVLRGDEQ